MKKLKNPQRKRLLQNPLLKISNTDLYHVNTKKSFEKIIKFLNKLIINRDLVILSKFSHYEDNSVLKSSNVRLGVGFFNSYIGILKAKSDHYVFQFNPLNQWKFEKNARLPATMNEQLAFLEENLLFEHDEPTYEFEFGQKDIAATGINDKGNLINPIILKFNVLFNSTII